MSKMQTPFILSGGESIVTAYAVEIKRKREIDESIISEVQSRIDRIPLRKGVTPRPVLV